MTARTIVVPTPKSVLPQHEGRPVPWVTRWSGEIHDTKLKVHVDEDGLVHIRYEDGIENRESNGLLWRREGLNRKGEPQYSELNVYRQRAAMNKRLCQVCGSKINDRPIRWLMGRAQLHLDDENGSALTISPPTCVSCIPLAQELCPYLSTQHAVLLKVLEYEPWGVYGEAVVIDPDTGRGRDLRGVYVPYQDTPIELSAVIAFQQVVRLTKFVIEEEFNGVA